VYVAAVRARIAKNGSLVIMSIVVDTRQVAAAMFALWDPVAAAEV